MGGSDVVGTNIVGLFVVGINAVDGIVVVGEFVELHDGEMDGINSRRYRWYGRRTS